jgi:CheY-like chemotaxis protein
MADTSKMDEKERQAKVSSLLHGTEAAIKKGELEDGLEKARAVYLYDSRNLYAHAFEERIITMIANRSAKPQPEPVSTPVLSPKTVAHEKKKALPPETPPVDAPSAPEARSDAANELRRAFELERAKWDEEKSFIIDRERLKTKERLLDAYRAFVMLMDVSIPKEQLETLLLSLRGILDVTEQEHAEIIRSVQVNAYVDTLRSIWVKGSVTVEETELLKQLCVIYGISDDEHLHLTRQVKRKLGIADRSGGILAVDDSKDILIFIEYVLKKTYANVRTALSVEEAAAEIRKEIPALIMSDVMMPDVGGFAFYDMIKRGEFGEEVKQIPFVFMSVCSDEYMKKIADNLGAQTYLTKPFSREILERTVKDLLKT